MNLEQYQPKSSPLKKTFRRFRISQIVISNYLQDRLGINVSQPLVSQWLNGYIKIPEHAEVELKRLADMAVSQGHTTGEVCLGIDPAYYSHGRTEPSWSDTEYENFIAMDENMSEAERSAIQEKMAAVRARNIKKDKIAKLKAEIPFVNYSKEKQVGKKGGKK